MSMRIERCVCFDRTFEELRIVAANSGAETLRELQRHVRFGERCGLCRPYVQQMLRTGETVFHHILTEDAAEL